MKVSAVEGFRLNNINFEGKKNKEIQKPVHSSCPIKAIPVAVLIAMSPLNAPKSDAAVSNIAATESYQNIYLDESSQKAHEVMQKMSLSGVKFIYATNGMKDINIIERTPIETRPYFGFSRSDVYLIDNNNDKSPDDLIVVMQSWRNNKIETVICSPQTMNFDNNRKEYILGVKAFIFKSNYDSSEDKIISTEIDKDVHNINYQINDNNLIQSLLRFYKK